MDDFPMFFPSKFCPKMARAIPDAGASRAGRWALEVTRPRGKCSSKEAPAYQKTPTEIMEMIWKWYGNNVNPGLINHGLLIRGVLLQ